MTPKINTPPLNDEIEVTVIGPGFGECVIIHFGNNEWVVIDSCTALNIKTSTALHYFELLDLKPEECVKAIFATHWDDDHIKKISELFEQSPNADFFISTALNDKKFQKLVLDSPLSKQLNLDKDAPTGISEFNKVFHILKKRNKTIRYSHRDQRVWKSESNPDTNIISLSPHDSIFEAAIKSIVEPTKTNGAVGYFPAPKPNFTSVVLLVNIQGIQLLLGADLEESSQHKGWSLIINESTYKDEIQAQMLKVAHHGSPNGDHPQIWEKLLVENPQCVIAPFNKGGKLPSNDDIDRILAKTDNLHLTASPHETKRMKNSERHVARLLTKRNAKMLNAELSLVRFRTTLASKVWNIEHFGKAKKVTNQSN